LAAEVEKSVFFLYGLNLLLKSSSFFIVKIKRTALQGLQERVVKSTLSQMKYLVFEAQKLWRRWDRIFLP